MTQLGISFGYVSKKGFKHGPSIFVLLASAKLRGYPREETPSGDGQGQVRRATKPIEKEMLDAGWVD